MFTVNLNYYLRTDIIKNHKEFQDTHFQNGQKKTDVSILQNE